MPFEITPEPYVPPGTPVEPQNSTSFEITPAPAPPLPHIDSFIQWQSGGYDLGDAKVLVVDFRYPLIATRGVGEHENVITVRLPPLPPPPPPPPSVYYTSILYPIFNEDAMALALAALERGYLLTVDTDNMALTVPTLQSGTLVVTISYLTYDPRAFPDNMALAVPTLQSGTLVVVISYLSYGPYDDNMSLAIPTLESGTLVVVIAYITYDNPLIYPDNMQIGVPTLLSGTLV